MPAGTRPVGMRKGLYFEATRPERLKAAWRHVRQNGLISPSAETQEAVAQFDFEADRRLERLYRQLLHRHFTFKPGKGVLKRREGKSPRPIVVHQLEDRIVQRSILSVLQLHPRVNQYVRVPTSFGGIEGPSVRLALNATIDRIRGGASSFVRSDIKDFFGGIPKEAVLDLLGKMIDDPDFLGFVTSAITVELENLGTLGRDAELFPIYEVGVAQGCALSPLFGNILLHDFDLQLNARGLHCLRYVDDFLLLGPSDRHVRQGFKSALRILETHSLSAYDPWRREAKASKGRVEDGFEFLGCEVSPDRILPGRKARARLRKKVRGALDESTKAFRLADPKALERANLVTTLKKVSNIIQGWGNQYSFCNSPRLWRKLDRDIDALIIAYLGKYKTARGAFLRRQDAPMLGRRFLGVHLLEDSKSSPILQKLQ